MSNSPPSPGPDLFFSGGECLTRFGVWIRRTDVDLEEAFGETFVRNSIATAIGRDGILRTWEIDTPRAEWLNEEDLDPTRNLMETSDMRAAPVWQTSGLLSVTKLDHLRERFQLVETVDGSTHLVTVSVPGVPDDNQVFTSGIFENKGTRDLCYITTIDKNANNFDTWFDLTGDGATLNSNHDSSSITKIGAGVYRCVVENPSGTGSGEYTVRLAIAEANGSLSYSGDGVSGLVVGSAQVEIGVATDPQEQPQDLDRKFPCLLLEKVVLNSWTRSEEFDDAVWTKQNANIVANDRAAPDGATTADFLREDSSNGNHRIQRNFGSISDNNFISWSLFARADTREWLALTTTRKDGAAVETWFDLKNGILGTSRNTAARIRRYGDDWYRCEVSEQVLSGGTAPVGTIQLALANEGLAYQGDNVSGFHIWGGQEEVNLRPTSSYIATDVNAQTRAGSVFEQPWKRKPVPMTVYAKFIERGTIDIGDGILVAIGNGISTFFQLKSQPGLYRTRHTALGANSIATASFAPVVGELVEVLGSIDEFGRAICTVQIPSRFSDPVTQVAGTDTGGLGEQWDDQRIFINSRAGQTLSGYGQYLAIKAHRGVRDLDFMRAL